MSFGNFSEFLAMGGYGLYVWGSLGMCAAAIAAELLAVAARRRALRSQESLPAMADMNGPTA